MLNIVIPMAGRGSRFAVDGFTVPKPFISVAGIPMVELVINNLRPACPHRFIFVCQQQHIELYDFEQRAQALAPGSIVIGLPGITEGAACTVLMASDYIDTDEPLMIANADQWVDVDINAYLAMMENDALDGLIMTLNSSDPKWSYVQKDRAGWVMRVVEKQVISDEATVGIYNFRRGRDFCRHVREMIIHDERSRGEFYVAPVYTRLYDEGMTRLATSNIGDGMYGLGTPEDLAAFMTSKALSEALRRVQVQA